MPYCPKCKAEYREGFRVCVDCKVALVSELPHEETVELLEGQGDSQAALDKYKALLTEGEQAFDAEDSRKALELLNEATHLNADDPLVWNLLGLTYEALGHDREAWRSFKFALRADQEDLHALWYAAHFLFEQEDYSLAMNFIKRYLELETDAAEIKEAEHFKEDVDYHLRSLEDLNSGGNAATRFEDEVEEEIPPDKFTILDEDEDEPELEDIEDEELPPEETDQFQADLQLMLTDRNSKCLSCGTALPTDAPYCFNCRKPHLYKPLD